jgi:hypothetical protein
MCRLAGVEVAGAQVGDDDGHGLAGACLVTRAHNLRTSGADISSGPADRADHFALSMEGTR